MNKTLFLSGKGSKAEVLNLWKAGKAFKSIGNDSNILSIKSIDYYRQKYSRICIQYDRGIIEV